MYLGLISEVQRPFIIIIRIRCNVAKRKWIYTIYVYWKTIKQRFMKKILFSMIFLMIIIFSLHKKKNKKVFGYYFALTRPLITAFPCWIMHHVGIIFQSIFLWQYLFSAWRNMTDLWQHTVIQRYNQVYSAQS